MNKENNIAAILICILYFILGVVLIAATNDFIKTFNYILVIISGIIGIIQLISFFVRKKYKDNNYSDLLLAVVFIWVSLILYVYYRVMINILPILFSLYLFVMACDMLVRYIQRDKDIKAEKWFVVYRHLILSGIALTIGLLLIFNPGVVIYVYLKITGVYLIVVSFLHFMDLFKNFKKEKLKNS